MYWKLDYKFDILNGWNRCISESTKAHDMSKKIVSRLCPCGNIEIEDRCCGPYISGQKIPMTAEALMRSRYTAYTRGNMTYIQATMREQAAENFDSIAALEWAKTAKWKRLKIVHTFSDTNTGIAYVKFIAYYIFSGMPKKLMETSAFKQMDGRWYYVGSV